MWLGWLPGHKSSRFQSRLGGRAVCGQRLAVWTMESEQSPPFTGKNSLQNAKFTKQKHKYIYQEEVKKKSWN